MTMITKKMLLAGVLLIPSYVLIADSFVAKKKTKLPSTTTLKTNCCDMCGDLLHLCADITEQSAQLQRELLEKSRKIIENDNEGFFATGTKAELQACYDKMETCKTRMVAFKKELEEQRMYVQSLK